MHSDQLALFNQGRKVEVYRKPVVALLSTGNELLDLQSPNQLPGDGWGGIWDTNRPSLLAALEGLGYEVFDVGIVPDELRKFSGPNFSPGLIPLIHSIESHVAAIKNGLERADVLLTTGGTSMGATDLLKPVIERQFNGTIHFGRVAVKPGKPTTFATIPHSVAGKETTKYVFALPGNPASALVTFHIFVLPALRKLGGWPLELCQLPRVEVTVRAFGCIVAIIVAMDCLQIQDVMKLDYRKEFHRVVIRAERGGLKAYSTGGQRSSRVASLSGANGLVILPSRKSDGPQMVKAGECLETVLIGEIQMQWTAPP
jgi:gephyrin